MSLRHSYTLLAPIYDLVVSKPLEKARTTSLARMQDVTGRRILVNGIGSGLDIPLLPREAAYTGTDITPAMLKQAEKRARQHALDIELVCADSQALPFDNMQFDIVVMHLILAVVPQPLQALSEASRVLKPGGSIYIFDKFLKPGERAITRRALNIISRHIATRMDVVFEDLLQQCTELTLVSDEPALAKGWFRLIELKKKHT